MYVRNQRCKAPQESGQLKPGGYGLDCGAYLSVMAGGELLGRFGDAGREATVKACGYAVDLHRDLSGQQSRTSQEFPDCPNATIECAPHISPHPPD